MRKFALLGMFLSVFSLSVPMNLSFASQKAKVQIGQGKTKAKLDSKKIKKVKKKENTKVKLDSKNVKKAKKKGKTKISYKRPRYATNINQPQEGQLLKLEGMVKDLNAQ
ncbi:MAG: hypothetical protein NZ526_04255 [Aquificaceae bacterium]|nr:hypothetical protein [Aquificaceae bacterium]